MCTQDAKRSLQAQVDDVRDENAELWILVHTQRRQQQQQLQLQAYSCIQLQLELQQQLQL